MGRLGGPVPMAGGRPLDALLVTMGRVGLWDEKDDGVGAASAASGDDSLDEDEDPSWNEATEESRNLDGILDCELVDGE